MTVSVASTDFKFHDVSIYSDISAEWVSGDNGLTANWGTYKTKQIVHEIEISAPQQQLFSEVNDHIQRMSLSISISFMC